MEVSARRRDHPDFVRRLARTVTDWKSRSASAGGVQDDGASTSRSGGVLPIVNLGRLHALANGLTISPTRDRLVAVQETNALEASTATALREAFDLVSRVRFEHHASLIQADRQPDNTVDLAELPPLTRLDLREAFRTVAAAQKQLGRYVPLGL